jgi:hypothetical protein
MKLFIAIFFFLSGLAYGQTNFRAVMVDSNGVLQRPTNFVTANQDVLYGTNQNPLLFNSINGQVTYTNTNALTFTNQIFVDSITASNDVVLIGASNTASNQTASSGANLMTRDLSDARYSFSRWYSAVDLVYLDNTTGSLKSTSSGNGSGNPISAQGVQIPDSVGAFNLPIDWRISGLVKVVSYWSDRVYTNVGATNATITVQSFPRTSLPIDNTTTNTQNLGTGITNTFTANYGGSGDSRYYIVEQTVDFGTVTNISGTNPMQIKTIQISRNTNDSSTNIIMLNGIHVYIP